MQEEEQFEGRGGALVEEAKRLMQNEEQEETAVENSGPKIKMNKIGKKAGPAKKGEANTVAKGASAPKAAAADTWKPSDKGSSSTGGGFSEQDIEFMKKAIQVLCQSTNPLGKSIDFVTDDIDSMTKEYDHWRKEFSACQSQLVEQQKITEEVI